MFKFWTIPLLFIILGFCSDRSLPSMFEARNLTIGETTYAYRVFVPKDRNPAEKLPVMLFLHGSAAIGDDNYSQVDRIKNAIEPVQKTIRFIIVAPQCRPGSFWAAQEMADYALAALDQSVREFDGDSQRLYLVGFSMGGYGVWQIAAGNPGKFAALVPIAGGIVEHPNKPPGRASIIPSVGDMLALADQYKEVAKAIGKTPVWIFHGAKDRDIPVRFSRDIFAALKAEGRDDVKYTEYPDDRHQIFEKAFAEPGLPEWLVDQRLNTAK